MMHNYKFVIIFAMFMAIIGCKKKKPGPAKGAKKANTHAVVHKKTGKRVIRQVKKNARLRQAGLLKKVRIPPFVREAHHIVPKRFTRPSMRIPGLNRTATRPRATRIKQIVPDVRLLLTVADMEDLGLKPSQYDRIVLPGKLPGPTYDSLNYRLKKHNFGISIQVWAFKNRHQVKAKYHALFAGLPNARTIDPVEGDTLFAYWGNIIYVGFMHPRQKVVVNLACSKKLCSSDKLYEIAKRVSGHLDMLSH